jgi:hypothetical protein
LALKGWRSVSFAKPITLIAVALVAETAFAQQPAAPSAPTPPAVTCPPGVNGNPPTVGGGGNSESLSEKLAESKGIICPPAGIDPGRKVTPPGGGVIKAIPPPGTPGGDQSVQPK